MTADPSSPVSTLGELVDSAGAALGDFALRTRSPLAHAAITARAQDGSAEAGLLLARVRALGPAQEADQAPALRLFADIASTWPAQEWAAGSAHLYAQLLVRAGQGDEAAALLPELALDPVDRAVLDADLRNPWVDPHGAAAEPARTGPWLDAFSAIFTPGTEPVALQDGPAATPYQRLCCPVEDHIDGDLVTVVMAAHRPADDIHNAVRSVLAQTWRSLELLVVDDCSGPEFGPVFEDIAGLDPRVRVVHRSDNAGTYAARNLALEHARGRYVTFHDADDWMHPRRLEVQVGQLQQTPGALANRTWALRARPDLTLTYVGYRALRMNASSLLFEREPVLARLGGFDETRKSGDMEFPLRLEAVRPGSTTDLATPAPMAVTQLRTGSLSRSDAVPGWTRWDRLAYRDSYRSWHEQVRAGRLPARLGPGVTRPFPLPDGSWSPEGTEPSEPDLDVCVLADTRQDHPGSPLALAAAQTTGSSGLRVGLCPVEVPDPLTGRRPRPHPEIQAAVDVGRWTMLPAERRGRVRAVLVTEPSALLHLPQAAFTADRVIVLRTGSPGPEDSSPPLHELDAACRRLWDTLPQYAVTGGGARLSWGGDLPSDRTLATALPLTVAPGPRPRRRWRPTADGSVVIGHHLPDRKAFWRPPADGSPPAYPVQDPYDVRFLQGCATGVRQQGWSRPPVQWLPLLGTAMTVPEFVHHLDVFVYTGPWCPAALVAALQAMALGCPAVLPLEAEGDLGGAAAYASADTLSAVLEEVARPDRGLPLGRAGQHLVRARRDTWAQLLRQAGLPTTAAQEAGV